TVGTGCAHRAIGNTAADGSSESILSCESVGTCQVWRAQVNCGATGLTVATVSGVPVCICRPAAAGTYYVDPSPGMAMYMNGGPTGANLPPACRLRSITDALAHVAASTGFDKVVVAHEFSSASAAPVHLNASTGESFPLIVPEAVTVTTAAAPAFNSPDFVPEHFVVDIGGAGCAHCAVKLEDRAVLSGLTIDASGAAAAPNGGAGVESVISCAETDAAQTALLDHVKVVAQDGQTGILVGGSCVLTASDVNVSGASLGVDVTRTATGAAAEARLVSQRLGVTSMVSGSIGVQVGTGLDGGTRSSAVLDGATVLTRNLGLSVRGGTLTLDGGSVSTSNPATEEGVGAQVAGGTVVLAGTLVSGGASFTGLEIAGGGQVTLQANATGATRLTTTLAASSTDSADGVVLLAGATAARLTIAGGTEVSHFHTGVVVNDGSVLTQGTDMAMAIKNNRANGIELLGRTAGVTVALSAGTVADNSRTGVVVRTTVPSTIQNLQITGNGQDGVDLQRTQTAAQSGYRLVFASNTVSGNGGRGIALTGKGVGPGVLLGGKVGVRLERNTVSGNAGVGIYVTEWADAADGDDVTEVSMDSNDVAGNLTAAATAPSSLLAGGVFFARSDATTRLVLGSYLGNRVHGNGRHEIAFDLAQDGGAAWNLSSNASAVDMATGCADAAEPNSVYCYDTVMGQDLGIAVSSSAIHVNVQNMHFQNAAPLAGRDYSLGIPMAEVTIPCAPLLCQ
ncbi:MAG: right-handed parallel beta-helix repeat-containing protein, partial [Polyangia bacterium]